MNLMVTGHRKLIPAGWQGNPYPNEGNDVILEHHNKLMDIVKHCIYEYSSTDRMEFITGMAIGADQLFANTVLDLRNEGLDCLLHAACPFKGQESKWVPASQEMYRYILSQCNSVTYVSEGAYAPYKMQVRNKWMVDRSNVVLALWDGRMMGGTWNCIQYALECNRKVDIINPSTFEFTQNFG